MTPELPEACFNRETGYSLSEWLRCLPGACGPHAVHWQGDQGAMVDLDEGHLLLRWEVLPPRRIALVSLPRMMVHYRFEGCTASGRVAFLRYFDRYMLRGGG